MLSDRDIKRGQHEGWFRITPFDEKYVQPASYDVHLADTLLIPYEWSKPTWLDRLFQGIGKQQQLVTAFDPLTDHQPLQRIPLATRLGQEYGGYHYLPPGGVALGATLESLYLDPDCDPGTAADIAGCSSLGRWFLFVHCTAGFIDPGWGADNAPNGAPLTIELYNASPWYIRLWAGMKIGQIRFYDTSTKVDVSYHTVGSYVGSTGPEIARYKG